MLLLSSLWAGGMAMASYCAVSMSQSQQAQLCGNGSGGAITFAQLGLTAPETNLPDAHDCDCELSQDNPAPITYTAVDFTPLRYGLTDGQGFIADANILRTIRSGYLSRGPPQSA